MTSFVFCTLLVTISLIEYDSEQEIRDLLQCRFPRPSLYNLSFEKYQKIFDLPFVPEDGMKLDIGGLTIVLENTIYSPCQKRFNATSKIRGHRSYIEYAKICITRARV